MRHRWMVRLAVVAGVVVLAGILGGGAVPGVGNTALAQQAPQLTAQGAPAPGTPAPGTPAPGTPGTPGTAPGYGPGMPGYPGYGPGYGRGFGPGRMMYGGGYGGGRGFGRRPGIAVGVFALMALLRFLLLVALLVIAWKVITLRSLWGRPDGAVQAVRERFARGEINEEEYRKRLVALS